MNSAAQRLRIFQLSLGTCWIVALMIGIGGVAKAAVVADSDVMLPWESRPYKVQLWICSDHSPEITSVLPAVNREIITRTELLDPSGWYVSVDQAPADWRDQLLNSVDHIESMSDLVKSDFVQGIDKLTVVCLAKRDGGIEYRIREFDVQTGQWGALFQRRCAQGRDLAAGIIVGLQRVFMPLARIDRVTDKEEVFLRARAIEACKQSDIFEPNSMPTPIENSPVWVRPDDRFLPIIRKVDRNGDLAEIAPVPFTYLTVENPLGSRMQCKLHSRQRLALGGRTRKRAQKLALVIRPPETPTQLKLVSRDEARKPLSGYEIFSRPPGAPKEQESEFLGLTDWRGMIEVPPTEDGLRLIFVKRGSRPLMKLPIIPGLYDQLETVVPDDEARLNAEGITSGFQIEILNLVAQRELIQSRIETAVENKRLDDARALLEEFRNLESGQNMKLRLADEQSRLLSSTLNKRETTRITKMFQQLNKLVSASVYDSVETELQAKIQSAKANAN